MENFFGDSRDPEGLAGAGGRPGHDRPKDSRLRLGGLAGGGRRGLGSRIAGRALLLVLRRLGLLHADELLRKHPSHAVEAYVRVVAMVRREVDAATLGHEDVDLVGRRRLATEETLARHCICNGN